MTNKTTSANDLVERLRSRSDALNTFPMDVRAAELLTEAADTITRLQAALVAAEKWRDLAAGLHAQLDWQGCTCTFPSDTCCAFAKYEAFALRDLSSVGGG